MSNISTSKQNGGNSAQLEVLTPEERVQLDMLGTIFSNFAIDGAPPKAYEIVALSLHYKGKHERKGYRHLLPHLEQMAANGLNVDQIARAMGMPESLLTDAMHYYPEIYHAIVGGRARGINEAATTVTKNAKAGETAAAKFKLQTKGEFSTGKVAPPSVQVNIGTAEAPIKSAQLDAMRDKQKMIIDEVDFSELN